MISVAEARSRILAGLRPVPTEIVALSDGWGRVPAQPVRARRAQPPADVSSMDGYALRAADGVDGAVLRVVGAAPAGHPYAGQVGIGEAVRLFTGSILPAGTDAVVVQENAERHEDRVTLRGAVQAGRHVRRAGEDFAHGDELLPAGRRLTARDVALAAAANHPWLTVRRRPRVAILSTGDEIVMPGEPVAPGGIIGSNAIALAALVRAGGGEPVLLPVVPDDLAAIAGVAEQVRGMDLLVTSGGASVGDHDLVQAGLGRHGFALDFWRIAMRPGKPLMYGRMGKVPVLGLPGNPVSAVVCSVLFLLPALAALLGLPETEPVTVEAVLGRAIEANDGRMDHLRAELDVAPDGRLVATPFARQDSGMLRLLARSDGLIVREPHAPAASAGSAVRVLRLDQMGA